MPKILVVDDEEHIVRILSEFLINNGFGVIKAGGGEQAIGLLNSGLDVVKKKLNMVTE